MFNRLLFSTLTFLLLTSALPAQAQRGWTAAPPEQKAPERQETQAQPAPELYRPQARPPEATPEVPRERRLASVPALSAVDAGATQNDSLSGAEVLRKLGRLYQLQSDILIAQAEGDADRVDAQFELAMTELGTLLDHPGILESARFRELYRSLVTEYEDYYDVPADSLMIQRGDVFQLRADLFAALNDVDAPLLEDVMMPEIEPIETTIPMTMNRLVEQSIAYLRRSPEDHLYRWMGRAETYFPMIEQIFKEEGVPDELKYLAMVESGLNPTARSWAKAVGMWQFIAATGSAYGLEVTPWVDERMDPEKATRAAARHLKDLYEMYDGDWQVAIAGYNCSPRCIRRAIRKSGKENATFWDIYPYLPNETRNYVPMFIAAALLTSNPDAADLRHVRPGPEYAYDYVPVEGMVSLKTIAEVARTDVGTIKALNPELRRESLPPHRRRLLRPHPLRHRRPVRGGLRRAARGGQAQRRRVRRPPGRHAEQDRQAARRLGHGADAPERPPLHQNPHRAAARRARHHLQGPGGGEAGERRADQRAVRPACRPPRPGGREDPAPLAHPHPEGQQHVAERALNV